GRWHAHRIDGHAVSRKSSDCRRTTRLASAVCRNNPHVARLHERDASIAGARGVEIRPRLLTAINAKRTDIGAITLGAQNRRAGATCGDKLGKATKQDAAIADTAMA